MEEYRNFIAAVIDGAANSIEFLNGLKLFAGQVVGDVSEELFRRIQIRETIQSHPEREAQLFCRGIKVLSLFFIDEVAKYRQYDDAVKNFATSDDDYRRCLDDIATQDTHDGYFSVDKKNRATNSKIDDADAYNLIMRNKVTSSEIRRRIARRKHFDGRCQRELSNFRGGTSAGDSRGDQSSADCRAKFTTR